MHILIGVWVALVFAEIAGIFPVWVYVKYRCAHSEGKLSDLYLIKSNGSELLYDVSLKATEVRIALEKITANIALINAKPVDFDVRILDNDGGRIN